MITTLHVPTRLIAVSLLCLTLSGCDDLQVYGSVTVSSYGGGYYGGGYYGGYGRYPSTRVGGSVTIGGRIR